MSKSEQPAHTGSGPLFERRYWVDVQHPRQSAAELMQHIQCHLPDFSLDLLADFKKSKGAAHCLEVDDEYRIKILGPWNGEVRVTAVDFDSF